MKIITKDGIKLFVQDSQPEASKPSILFIHGWRQSLDSWKLQFDSVMLANNYRLVAFDLRGHGQSDQPNDKLYYESPERWADDIDAVINQLKLHKPILVAWSSGAMFVCDYVKKYGCENISGIQFVTPMTRGYLLARPGVQKIEQSLYINLSSTDTDIKNVAVEQFIKYLFKKEASLPSSDFYQLIRKANTHVSDFAAFAFYSRGGEYTCSEILKSVSCPSQVICGKHDAFISLDDAKDDAKTLGISPTIYYHSGHSPFIEESYFFNQQLDFFAQQCRSKLGNKALFSQTENTAGFFTSRQGAISAADQEFFDRRLHV